MALATHGSPIDLDGHVVEFYEDDADMVGRVAAYLSEGLDEGAVGIAIVTPEHRRALQKRIGRPVLLLDAAETLAQLTCDGRIDADRFDEVVGGVIREAAATGRPIRAFGEMVALLWDAGDVPAAIELETLWNELRTRVPFSLYCAYHSESVAAPEHAEAFRHVCHLHSAVLPTPPGVETREFAAGPASPRAARHYVADALRRRGYTGEVLEDAQLVLTELATNAVLHARSGFAVAVGTESGAVRISVRDDCPETPRVRDPGPLSPGGRGMRLVSTLAHRWGVDATADGKLVWVELRR